MKPVLFSQTLLLLMLMFSTSLMAQSDEDWGDDAWATETTSPWSTSGFLAFGYGQFLQDNIVKHNFSLNETTGRLNVNYQHKEFDVSAKFDFGYDAVTLNDYLNTRELYISTQLLSSVDIKIGRQILTWGTGDYLFLNDLFAKDWQSFFSGRDDEYLKAPSDSIRATAYFSGITFDLAWTKSFTPDTYLTGERFSFYSPQAGTLIAPNEQFQVEQTADAQWAARIAKSINGVELAVYGYDGFWPTPQGINESGVAFFPTLSSIGASIRTTLGAGIVNSEFAYYRSKDDKNDTQGLVANSQRRFLIGYEQELVKNLTASMQFYIENTLDYQRYLEGLVNPQSAVAKYRQLVTTRLTYRSHQQKLTSSLFVFYSPTDNDSYIRPSVQYRMDDKWLLAAGLNMFYGKNEYSFFGQHEDNSNLWFRVKYQF